MTPTFQRPGVTTYGARTSAQQGSTTLARGELALGVESKTSARGAVGQSGLRRRLVEDRLLHHSRGDRLALVVELAHPLRTEERGVAEFINSATLRLRLQALRSHPGVWSGIRPTPMPFDAATVRVAGKRCGTALPIADQGEARGRGSPLWAPCSWRCPPRPVPPLWARGAGAVVAPASWPRRDPASSPGRDGSRERAVWARCTRARRLSRHDPLAFGRALYGRPVVRQRVDYRAPRRRVCVERLELRLGPRELRPGELVVLSRVRLPAALHIPLDVALHSGAPAVLGRRRAVLVHDRAIGALAHRRLHWRPVGAKVVRLGRGAAGVSARGRRRRRVALV
eukprot:scaffold231464_cov32-Tisochrysis_lutea.AAC.2